jgi:hypothetical protein
VFEGEGVVEDLDWERLLGPMAREILLVA